MNINVITNDNDFMYKWTALYSSNFNSKHLHNFDFNYQNYSGKPIEVKLAQFRVDWERNQRKSEPQHISQFTKAIMSNLTIKYNEHLRNTSRDNSDSNDNAQNRSDVQMDN